MKIFIWTPSNNGNDLKAFDKNRGIHRLKSMGYDIVTDENVEENYLNLGINKPSKTIDFFSYFLKSNNDIILPYYGGLTSNLIVDNVIQRIDPSTNSLLCGKSDLTSLLNALYRDKGLVSLYGIDLSKLSNPNLTKDELKLIKNSLKKQEIKFNCPETFNDGYWYLGERKSYTHDKWKYFYKDGEIKKISGISVGGNLESLCTLLGTDFSPDFQDKLVVVEAIPDVSPKRFLMHFKHLLMGSNIMKSKGILIGKSGPNSLLNDETFLYKLLVEELNIKTVPILYNIDFSHTEPSYPFYIGGKLEVNLEKQVIKVSIN